MAYLEGNCLLAQSGGPTAVINASACGIIQRAMKEKRIKNVYAALNGIEGVIEGKLIDMGKEAPFEIELLKISPASAFGSCRYKLKDYESDKKVYEEIFDCFERNNIRFFFYIGGNDSMDTACKLSRYAEVVNYDIKILGVPKTIDNDLYGTDHCPGFGSAAKFIATSLIEIARDADVYNKNIVTIVEVMGRNAGWLAASSVLANEQESGIPDLIYLPEVPFVMERFLEDVKRVYKEKGKVLIVVSEGIQDKEGRFISQRELGKKEDVFGNVLLGGCGKVLEKVIKQNIEPRVKTIELGILQRCAMHWASRVDIDEAYMAGSGAVDYALRGHTGKMVSLIRETVDGEYRCKLGLYPLEKVANRVKKLPVGWINKEHNYVKPEVAEYIRPLIQGEVTLYTKDGLPRYVKLKKYPV